MRKLTHLVFNKFSTIKQGGNVYTWGKNTSSLGYKVSANVQSVTVPKKLNQFPENSVAQIDMGQNHSAIITTNGELYTFGNGKHGALGHNDGEMTYTEPTLVKFFSKNNLKVKQVVCGENFTMALTTDGDVWTWGFGGRQLNFFLSIFFSRVGPLGHGDFKSRFTPTPVESLRQLPPATFITAGLNFANVINKQGDLYNWGKGDYGVFGDGYNKSLSHPRKNEYFERLRNDEKLTIKKIKSSNNFSVALMTDGKLYGWGSNEHGQMGIKNEIGVELYETANFPTPIVNEDFSKQQIVDYDIGEDIMAILLDNNQVWWSGMKIAYKPERLQLPDNISKIKKIGCCFRSIVVITEDNKIYMKNDFMQHQSENDKTGIRETTNQIFGGGNILQIGGNYRNKFAIVQQNENQEQQQQRSQSSQQKTADPQNVKQETKKQQ